MEQAPKSYSVSDPCFDPAIGARINVWLDGKRVGDVVAYDTIKGQILAFKSDGAGSLVLNPKGDAVVTELLEGKVEATLSPE